MKTNALKNLQRLSTGGQIQRLETKFSGIEKLNAATLVAQTQVAAALRPLIVAALDAAYAHSGLGKRSVALYNACVSNVVVTATPGAIRVAMPSGLDPHVYARAGAFKFGGLRGADATGKVRASLKNTFSKAARKTGQTAFGGATLQPARPGFFAISYTAPLQARYLSLLQDSVDRIIRGR